MTTEYPYELKRQIATMVETLESLVQRDPEQEVDDFAIPVLDKLIETVRQNYPDNPVVQAARGVISVQQIESGDPVRAAAALLVLRQLDAVIGPYPLASPSDVDDPRDRGLITLHDKF